MTNKPTNGELYIMLENLDEKVDRILEQTTKTNGRVTSIEAWKWKITGAVAVITFFIGLFSWGSLSSFLR